MALYAEGRSDELFLPNIIQRTAAKILGEHSHTVVDVQLPILVEPVVKENRQANILAVARQAQGYHLLIVHIVRTIGPTNPPAAATNIAFV